MFSIPSILFSLVFLALSTQAPVSPRSISGGPVITDNFPDPSIINVDGVWYAFATNNGVNQVQTASSPDLNSWTVSGSDALDNVGAWATTGATWAPDVIRMTDGTFRLYYTALSAATNIHCIGVASSNSVQGPYQPEDNALACADDQGGAIDPAGFRDTDGTLYVVYKIDGNSIGHGGNCNNGVEPIVPTPIMLQQLAADGITPVGDPTQVLDRDDGDGPLVEAPSLALVDGTYVLFFSSNCYSSEYYDVSYATSTNGVRGPYTKAGYPVAPLLVTGSDNGALYAPGGLDIDVDGTTVVWHADLGTTADTRQMWSGKVSISGQTVSI